MNQVEVPDKDIPLRDDIRLLGRILGDTVREQEGEAVFDIVERIRQTSIRFHRDEDEAARQRARGTLNSLSRGQAIQIIRAFSYFSHLANIAEDQHHIRRTRAHAWPARAPREGTIAHALTRAREAGHPRAPSSQAFFARAYVCPVLTAHPTEVRRKSTIDREMEVARAAGRARRMRAHARGSGGKRGGAAPRRADAVADQPPAQHQAHGPRRGGERPLLLRLHLPARAAALLRDARGPARRHPTRPGTGASCRRSCAWEAGSAATATAIPSSRPRCCGRRCGCRASGRSSFYLEELHAAGRRAVARRAAGRRLRRAAASWRSARPTARRTARNEPYRRAISGIYARLAATAAAFGHARGAAPCRSARRRPMPTPPSSVADLDVLHRLARRERLGDAGARPAAAACAARSTCSASISPALDLRQNSDVHERAVGELLRGGAPRHGLCRRSPRSERVDAAARRSSRRRARSPRRSSTIPPRPRPSSTIVRAAAEAHRHYGEPRCRTTSSRRPTASPTCSRSRCCSRRRGCCGRARHELDVNIVPLFETIDDLRNCGGVMDELLALPEYARLLESRGRRPGGDARLFRQQQGWRLPHLRLGALQGRDRAGRDVPPPWTDAAPVPRPRRLGRPRRRPELSGHPRAAGRRRAGRDPHHRAGRGDRGKYSNPEVGRRNLEILAAATLEATLLQPDEAAPRAEYLAAMEELSRHAYPGLPGPRLRDRRLRALFLGIDRHRRDRQPEHRQPSRLAQELAPHRGPARDPLGVQLGAMPADAAGLVRLRQRRSRPGSPRSRTTAWRCCRRCTASGRSSRRCCRTWTWCWRRATSPSPRAMPSWSPTRRCARRSSRACAREWQTSIDALLADHGPEDAAGAQSAAGPLDPQPLSLSRSAQPHADRAAEAPPGRRHGRERRAGHPPDHQRHRGAACATAADGQRETAASNLRGGRRKSRRIRAC